MTLAWSRFEAGGFGDGVVVCGGRVVLKVFLPGDWDSLWRRVRAAGLSAGQEERGAGAASEAAEVLSRCFFGDDVYTGQLQFQYPKVGPFTLRVLQACARIPRGEVCSYADLATEAGNPKATRAVGNAMAGNEVPLLIPCHRVVLSDGRLGNYGGGVEMKRELLKREGSRIKDKG
jgi:O-6-methylguanine DNA methyltransferase